MANQVALGAWTRAGDEIIVQRWAHVTTYEAGAPGYLHGLQSITLGDRAGGMEPELVREAIRPDFEHCPRTALVCVEQTHNVAGGRVIPWDQLEAVRTITRAAEVPVHMDGARLANAVVASGVPAARWASLADSVSICLSKGLGAPVGSLIERLGAIDGLAADPAAVDTNIVMVEVTRPELDAAALATALDARGVRVLPFAARTLRFVTHLDVAHEDVDRLEAALHAILG
jgi:threonine aldolase